MNRFPFISTSGWLLVFRILVGLMMMAHGAIRLIHFSIPGFGEFLDSQGFHPGEAFAWMVTIGDILFGLLVVFGIFLKISCIWFIGLMLFGIFLVHGQNGWFVVGHQTGGIEFNVLLIFCFLLIASTSRQKGLFK